jgi:hypothetical protein
MKRPAPSDAYAIPEGFHWVVLCVDEADHNQIKAMRLPLSLCAWRRRAGATSAFPGPLSLSLRISTSECGEPGLMPATQERGGSLPSFGTCFVRGWADGIPSAGVSRVVDQEGAGSGAHLFATRTPATGGRFHGVHPPPMSSRHCRRKSGGSCGQEERLGLLSGSWVEVRGFYREEWAAPTRRTRRR